MSVTIFQQRVEIEYNDKLQYGMLGFVPNQYCNKLKTKLEEAEIQFTEHAVDSAGSCFLFLNLKEPEKIQAIIDRL